MPTVTANKAGLRATATAKRTKAAQRTPLPTKDLRENIALVKEEIPKAPRTPRATAAELAPKRAPKPEQSTEETKAAKYAALMRSLGWEPEITRTGTLVELIARRGNEALYLVWEDEALIAGNTYTIDDRTVKIRNAAEAMRIAALQPEQAAQKQAKVAANRQFRKRPTGPTIRSIPFDVNTATDAEVTDAVEARRVSWHNGYRVDSETATVGNRAFIKISGEAGARVVSFVDPESGYRAFRLDQLENVGRRVDLVRIKQQIISSLSRPDRKKAA